MTVMSVEEAAPRLRELVQLAAQGEQVFLTDEASSARIVLQIETPCQEEMGRRPDELVVSPEFAEASPLEYPGEPGSVPPRTLGAWKGLFTVGPEFFDALPEDELSHGAEQLEAVARHAHFSVGADG